MTQVQAVTSAAASYVPTSFDLRNYVPKDLRPGLGGGIYLGPISIGGGRCEAIDPNVLALSGKVRVPDRGEHDIRVIIRLVGPNDALVTVQPLFTDKKAKVSLDSGKLRFDLEQPVPATPITMWFQDRNFLQGSKHGFEFTYGIAFSPYFWFDKA